MNIERECITHHYACDCREAKIKRLTEAANELIAYDPQRTGRQERFLRETLMLALETMRK